MNAPKGMLAPDEQGLLQEIMNIAFGQAAADLAEVVDLFLVLSIPEVRFLNAPDIPAALASAMEGEKRISLVEQAFWGHFKGSGYLVLPSGAARELVSLLGNTSPNKEIELPAKELEAGTLMEVGNILIGACVGKLAELLDDRVTYSPPLVTVEGDPLASLAKDVWAPETTAIVLKTLFRFHGRNVKGFLFLVTSQDSIDWLRTALAAFLGRYA